MPGEPNDSRLSGLAGEVDQLLHRLRGKRRAHHEQQSTRGGDLRHRREILERIVGKLR